MRYLGIDPGFEGAIGAVDELGRFVGIRATPTIEGGRGQYDLVEIKAVLQEHVIEASGSVFVTLEKLNPLPRSMGGANANYARGISHGWEWMLVALGIPYQLVGPQRWQRKMLAEVPGDDTGQRAVQVAKRLWPAVRLRRSERARKDDHNFADALLLSEWGRREQRGETAAEERATA